MNITEGAGPHESMDIWEKDWVKELQPSPMLMTIPSNTERRAVKSKGLEIIRPFCDIGSDVLPIFPLGGVRLQIWPHILKGHRRLPISG